MLPWRQLREAALLPCPAQPWQTTRLQAWLGMAGIRLGVGCGPAAQQLRGCACCNEGRSLKGHAGVSSWQLV